MSKKMLLSVFLLSSQANAAYVMEDLLSLSLADLATIPVVTAARTQQHWDDVQGSLWVITEKEIRERGYRNIADVLRDLPSVDLQGPVNTTSRLTVRGVAGNAKMLILQDGVRVGATAGEVIPVSLNYPLYMAKQIEVLLTAGSALYGTDAVAGVINIISQTPSQYGVQHLHYEANDTGSQYGDLLVRGRIGNWPLVLGIHQDESNNKALAEQYPDVFVLGDLRDVSGSAVMVSAANRQPFSSEASSSSAWARINILPQLELGGSYRQTSYANDYSTLPQFNEYGGFLDESFLSLYGRFEQRLNETWSTNTLLSWSSYQLNKNSYYNNVFSNYQAGYKYADSQKLALDSQWTYVFSPNHQVVFGGVYEHLKAVPRTTDLSQPYNKNLSITEQNLYYFGTNNTLPVQIFDVAQENVALFAQDQTRWSPALVTQIGARVDQNSDYGDSVSPYLGFKYNFTPVVNLSMTYSEAFLAPSPSFSYEHFGSFSGQQDNQGRYTASVFRIPNPDLQPEMARALEAIVNYNPTNQLRWTATAYTSRLDNLILYSADTPVAVSDFVAGGYINRTKQRVNLGASVASGIELSSRYRYNANEKNVDLWGAYSFTEGTLESDKGHESLPYTARHKLKLGATFRWSQGLFVSPSVYLIDKSRVPNSAAQNGRSLVSPAYGLLNIYAGYDQIIAGINAFLRIENVTSRRYYNAGGTSDISIVQLPQLRRSVTLGTELEF